MKNRLKFSFTKLIKDQTAEFFKFYFFAIICLYFTHKIQSELPFKARELAELTHSGGGEYDYYIFIWLALGIIIFRTSSRILFFYPARILQKLLREELLLKLQNASPVRYKKYSSGQLFQYLTGDIDQIRALIGFVGLQGGNFIIGLLVLIPKLISFNSSLMVALTPMLIAFFIFTFIVSRNREYFKKMQESQGEVQNIIIESYLGKKTIKNFHAEQPFIELFQTNSLKELFYFYRSSLGISITLPLIAFGIGLSMLWGAYIIKVQHLGAGTLILFSGFIFLFMEPLGYLSWIGVVISRSSASWKRLMDLNEILETETQTEIELRKLNLNSNQYQIPFWNNVLPIRFEEGKWNVLISKTGHGKTHLLEHLAEILFQQKKSVSMVFQDPYIYNDSIENNIFLGRKATFDNRELAKKMLALMGLDFLDQDLEKLMHLEVGENGKRLSGGQAKRLALVRSIMSEAQYILWDDPFSSVDLILEKEIIARLKTEKILAGRTIILSSHRLTTVRSSDVAIYFGKDEGIIEEGNCEKLLEQKGAIYEYFKQQMV